MASITVTDITLRLSKLVKDGSKSGIDIPDDLLETLEMYVSEVIQNPSIVVEVSMKEDQDD